MNRRAFITGIAGQDGSYLAEHLLSLDYEVHGFVRNTGIEFRKEYYSRLQDCIESVCLHTGDVQNYGSLYRVLAAEKFDEIYHLAAVSHVGESYKDSFSIFSTNFNGTHNLLEAALNTDNREARIYFAGTSEQFGNQPAPQSEDTPMEPVSPYGFAKLAAYNLCDYYRRVENMWIARGILFNHESPRRGDHFVTRKITRAVAAIKQGRQKLLTLGNVYSRRDFGDAREYVVAMHRMLQQNDPEDFVVATGQAVQVRDVCEHAFAVAGLESKNYVQTSSVLHRPSEIHELRGDSARARVFLDWEPRKSWKDLIAEMVVSDCNER